MIWVSLCCNDCGILYEGRRNNKHAILHLRRKSSQHGWYRKPHSGDDFCPKCKTKLPKFSPKPVEEVNP